MYWKERNQRVHEYDVEITVAQITSAGRKGVAAATIRPFNNHKQVTEINFVPRGTAATAAVLMCLLDVCEHFTAIDDLKIRVWTKMSPSLFELKQPKLFNLVIKKLGSHRLTFAQIRKLADEDFDHMFLHARVTAAYLRHKRRIGPTKESQLMG
jgi:hypothetical protein